jgi:hypothetical protein
MPGGRNAYELWFEAGARECWVRRVTWSRRYTARLLAMRDPKGPPPYYGNVGFEYEIWGPSGPVRWEPITVWGNYSWELVADPRVGSQPLTP